MDDYLFQKEQDYLKKVTRLINAEIKENKKYLGKHESDLKSSWDYMWNNSGLDSGDIANLKAEQDIESSLFANRFLRDKILKKMKPKPYFGRIDFKTKKTLPIYIGFGSVMDKKFNSYVYDWRTPIASMYYDFEKGNSFYDCNEGRIEGEIVSKKQYKIEDGNLLYMFESDVNIEDDILKEALSKNTDEKMHDIVNTIQKEQNSIIRNVDDEVLLVEGPAGCGKTSVGLHRIAFLLYRYRQTLAASQVLIFSPNKVFTDYIDEVLPSLGEQNAMTTMFSEYIDNFIEDYKDVEGYMEFIERVYETRGTFDNESIKVKLADNFQKAIDEYLKYLLAEIKYQDVYLKEKLVVSKEDLAQTYQDFKYLSPYQRIEKMIENTIMNFRHLLTLEPLFVQEKIRPTIRNIVKKGVSFEPSMKKTLHNMYRSKKFKEILKKYFPKLNVDSFCENTSTVLKEQNINYEDAIILMYIKGELNGFYNDSFIKQIVIDEGQDYNKMQYYILSKTFKKASFTILGDANQIINPLLEMSDLTELKDIFKEKDTNYLKLKTTYRNTFEITNFANKILGLSKVNPIDRHGEEPKVIRGLEFNDLISKVIELLDIFGKSVNKTMAIILKDIDDAEKIYKELTDQKIDASLYNEKSALSKKIIVLPVCYAKGLEFDEVCVIETKANRFLKNEQKLLYVAVTRPLQKLSLLSEK